MFDIGFWELALIGVIALLVVGPDRLPALARNVGLWVGRVRRYVSHVKQDIERELHADELREMMQKREGLSDIREVAQETAAVFKDARSGLDEAARASEGGEAGGKDAAQRGDGSAPAAEDSTVPSRPIPHHAVDEDPFAPERLSPQTPDHAEAGEPAPSAEPDDEPSTDRPGRG